jgi:type II secretory pathway pseudopilin PulG
MNVGETLCVMLIFIILGAVLGSTFSTNMSRITNAEIKSAQKSCQDARSELSVIYADKEFTCANSLNGKVTK